MCDSYLGLFLSHMHCISQLFQKPLNELIMAILQSTCLTLCPPYESPFPSLNIETSVFVFLSDFKWRFMSRSSWGLYLYGWQKMTQHFSNLWTPRTLVVTSHEVNSDKGKKQKRFWLKFKICVYFGDLKYDFSPYFLDIIYIHSTLAHFL